MSQDEELIFSERRRDARRGKDMADGAFSVMQDNRYGNRLGFRFANGKMHSLPYTHLVETQYDPDAGIILTYATYRVTIAGRNLTALYLRIEEEIACEIIERHKYHDMVPNDPQEKEAWNSAAYIERISWEKL